MIKNINYWYVSSLLVSLLVALPILTVFASFFGTTSEYYELLKNTFLFNYIGNSTIILLGVLSLTFIFGVLSAYFVSFYNFPGVNFFKWALILSFAVPAYIYAYSLTAFFENFGSLFALLKWIFGEGDYNKYIPKFDGMMGAIISMSFSLFGYVYVLTRASFYHQSHNLIEVSKNLGFSAKESLFKALYPITGKRFYFHDATRRDSRSLTLLKTLSADWKAGTTIPFRWRERQQGVLSWIALPR